MQSSGSVATRQLWETAGNRRGTKDGAIFWERVHRQDTAGGGGGKNLKRSAFTSQSEISRIGTLSFLWCSFRVKRIALFLSMHRFQRIVPLSCTLALRTLDPPFTAHESSLLIIMLLDPVNEPNRAKRRLPPTALNTFLHLPT
jgi:hypothetical protein